MDMKTVGLTAVGTMIGVLGIRKVKQMLLPKPDYDVVSEASSRTKSRPSKPSVPLTPCLFVNNVFVGEFDDFSGGFSSNYFQDEVESWVDIMWTPIKNIQIKYFDDVDTSTYDVEPYGRMYYIELDGKMYLNAFQDDYATANINPVDAKRRCIKLKKAIEFSGCVDSVRVIWTHNPDKFEIPVRKGTKGRLKQPHTPQKMGMMRNRSSRYMVKINGHDFGYADEFLEDEEDVVSWASELSMEAGKKIRDVVLYEGEFFEPDDWDNEWPKMEIRGYRWSEIILIEASASDITEDGIEMWYDRLETLGSQIYSDGMINDIEIDVVPYRPKLRRAKKRGPKKLRRKSRGYDTEVQMYAPDMRYSNNDFDLDKPKRRHRIMSPRIVEDVDVEWDGEYNSQKRKKRGGFEGAGTEEGILGGEGFCTESFREQKARIQRSIRRGNTPGQINQALGRLKGAYSSPVCKKDRLNKLINWVRANYD